MLDRVDVIHVLRGGRVVGSGTHAELLRRDDAVGARYRRIVARTTSDAEPTAGEELDAPGPGRSTRCGRAPPRPAPSAPRERSPVMSDGTLPVAGGEKIREVARTLVRRHRGELLLVIALHAAAALAGLVGLWLIGRMIDALTSGTADMATIDVMFAALAGAVIVEAFVTRFAQLWSLRLGRASSPGCEISWQPSRRSRSPSWSAPAPATSSPARRATSTRWRRPCASVCRGSSSRR